MKNHVSQKKVNLKWNILKKVVDTGGEYAYKCPPDSRYGNTDVRQLFQIVNNKEEK